MLAVILSVQLSIGGVNVAFAETTEQNTIFESTEITETQDQMPNFFREIFEPIMYGNQEVLVPKEDKQKTLQEISSMNRRKGRSVSTDMTLESEFVKFILPQESANLMSQTERDNLLNQLNDIVKLHREFVGVNLNEKMLIQVDSTVGSYISYMGSLKMGYDTFKGFYEDEIKNGRIDSIVQYLGVAINYDLGKKTYGNSNFYNLTVNIYDYLINAYYVEKLNLNMQELTNYYTRNVYPGIDYRKCFEITHSQVMDGTYYYPYFDNISFTYTLLGIKDKIGWEPFKKAMNDVFKASETNSHNNLGVADRINLFLDTLAIHSKTNIHNMFTEQEDGNKVTYYFLEDEIDFVKGSIEGDFVPKEISYEIKFKNLVLKKGDLTPGLTWQIDDVGFFSGENEIKITATDSNNKKLEKTFKFQNSAFYLNLDIDRDDTDNDDLMNYQEELLGTRSNL